ncbi:MAG: serine/threonine protein phosphatase PrpC [Motiliproteus sp.]|jgi:serine/threonine protein phosphatase PrpC
MATTLQVSFGGHSIAGIKAENQDAFAALQPDSPLRELKGAVCALADGVSSSAESHIASQTSVTDFVQQYFSTPDSWTVKTSAGRVLHALNRWLYQHGNSGSRARNSLVTTFSALVIKSTTAHLLHVGDSRIYRLRGGQLEQLTRDHASTYGGDKSYLTRALGVDPHLEVDYQKLGAETGDLYLLSSDGLHEFIGHKALETRLATLGTNLETEAKNLVETALKNGSDDNISALLLRIDSLPLEDLEEAHLKLTQLPIPPVLKPGNRLDGYEVQEELYSGTRSHLYLVRDQTSKTLYCLKTPSLNFSEDPLYLDGFIKEEWVGKRINHPGVMKTFSPERPKQFLYYLAEYLPDQHLRQWAAQHPQPGIEPVCALVKQIAQGLRALQRLDMIHQDLKPENILVDAQGRTKLIDFGTVRIAGMDEISSPLERYIPQGSINYVAPEYLRGQPGSHRSDLFSLGVIAYELLTGQVPFKERRSNDYQIKAYSDLSYIPARQHRPELPEWIDGALRKACAPDPARRYSALSEFLYDLEHPNKAFIHSERQKPLLEKNPLLFWKGLSALLALLLLLQWLRLS